MAPVVPRREGWEMMIFRFEGKAPVGKFEFTCSCGHWNQSRIDGDLREPKVIPCTNCGSEIRVWEQKTHWHVTVSAKEEK